MTWQVIEEVEMKGGRFLEYNGVLETWTELTDRSRIRHKIATHFKEYRRKVRDYHRRSNAQSEAPDDGRQEKRIKIGFESPNIGSVQI